MQYSRYETDACYKHQLEVPPLTYELQLCHTLASGTSQTTSNICASFYSSDGIGSNELGLVKQPSI